MKNKENTDGNDWVMAAAAQEAAAESAAAPDAAAGRRISFRYRGTVYDVGVERRGDTLILTRDGEEHLVELLEKEHARMPADQSGRKEKAPITGTVRDILIRPGDTVDADQVLFVMEAMKMYIEVYAAAGGTVTKVMVKPGERVMTGQVLARIR